MNEKINLQIQFSVEDYARGLAFVRNRQYFFKYGLIILPLFPLAFYFFDYWKNPAGFYQLTWSTALINFIPIFLLALFFLSIRFSFNPLVNRVIKKQIQSSPLLQARQEVSFDDAGIRGETALSSALTKWDAVIEAAETDADFFFFIADKKALFVPKSAFADEFQINLLRGLLRVKLGEKAKF